MINTPSMQDLLEAGVHFGHQVRRGHPRMKEYIFGARDGVHIINLESSEKLLKKALEYIYSLGVDGKTILFIGTKKQAQQIIKEAAKRVNAPYISYRWLGGTLTNFEEIRKNIRKLIDLKGKGEKGELTRYTKKEQLLISRKLGKFEEELGGIAGMEKLPDAVFIVDCVNEKTALNEANRLKIPVIAIADTNSNPHQMDYPIPGNDDATKAIKIITDAVAGAYEAGLRGDRVKAGEGKTKEKAVKDENKDTENEAIAPDIAAAEEMVEKEIIEEAKGVV